MLVKSWLFYLWSKPVKLTDLSWKSHSNLWHVKNTSMTIRFVCLAYYSMGAYRFFYFLHISYILFLSQIRTLDFKRRMSFSFCFVFNTLKWEIYRWRLYFRAEIYRGRLLTLITGSSSRLLRIRFSADLIMYWFPVYHFQCMKFKSLVIWIWYQNIAISTIVGTSSHIIYFLDSSCWLNEFPF